LNWQHFRTFVWLQWRIRQNQLRRGGLANVIVLAVLAVIGAFIAVCGFLAAHLIGKFVLARVEPAVVMLVWDVVVIAFLFFWLIGLVHDLQRSETLSLDKFLHLPVSLTSAFLINYLTTLVCPCLVIFLPVMVGLTTGLTVSRGPAMLGILPLVAGFLLMVTALTYQFQGWLAALMVNKRRRRTIVVVTTMAVILLAQLPNLINIAGPWRTTRIEDRSKQRREEAELREALRAGKIDHPEFQRRTNELARGGKDAADKDRQALRQLADTATVVNLVLPLGWLPLGAMGLADRNPLPAILGTLGLGLIGAGSLWRSYRTTLRIYTGQLTGEKRPSPAATVAPGLPKSAVISAALPTGTLLERHLPGLSEQAAAVALAGFRSLLRAPEAKMMLLTPIIMLVVFGGMFLSKSPNPPEYVRPLIATGALVMVLLSMGQVVANQFGLDRSGFRVFVLCPARRGDILLGKNLSTAPLAAALAGVAIAALQVFMPMRWDHFLAIVPQFVSMYFLYCLMANWLSIFAPIPIAAGSMRPANFKFVPFLLHLVFTLVFGALIAPALAPLGIEFLLRQAGWTRGLPVCLLLSLVLCAGVILLYRLLLPLQGDLLQAREQQILETVTTKAE
jgi:ABC-2 type transport system permease protein